jgi:hypothetical protein
MPITKNIQNALPIPIIPSSTHKKRGTTNGGFKKIQTLNSLPHNILDTKQQSRCENMLLSIKEGFNFFELRRNVTAKAAGGERSEIEKQVSFLLLSNF